MRKSKAPELSILEILEVDPSIASKSDQVRMIQKLQEELVMDAKYGEYQRGYDAGFKKASSISNILNSTLIILGIAIIPISVLLYMSAVGREDSRLDNAEMLACSNGQYAECLSGWMRNSDSERVEGTRMKLYEEAYFRSTSKSLIADKNSLPRIEGYNN